ncbi:MAG: response regulator [Nostoc sp. ChiQUE01a]|nr:response regulator [Nostoc sp. DedQUE11]MDZ8240618.1 response regulator [Nostoc sp. ChiQUE01a]
MCHKLFPDMCYLASLRKGLRVLVVDSDLDSCELLATLFAEYAVETTTAISATEALEMIQHTQPDILISEIILPDEDGYWLIRKVKTFERTSRVRIPAIALTVCVEKSERIHALTAGFCRHLAKPLNINELIATMASITGHPQEMSANTCQ